MNKNINGAVNEISAPINGTIIHVMYVSKLHQGSYRSSTVKFPDFSLTFQVME